MSLVFSFAVAVEQAFKSVSLGGSYGGFAGSKSGLAETFVKGVGK
jgi:hypothetical protein